MLIQKSNPVGIDKIIDQMQVRMFNQIDIVDWANYPRSYKNFKKKNRNSKLPELHIGNGEYEDVLFSDRFNLTTFFVESDTVEMLASGMNRQELSLIIQADLQNIYPFDERRNDEELRILFANCFSNWMPNVKIKNFVKGIENVYAEFNKDQLFFDDMSSFNVQRINFSVTFSIECCDC